MNETNGREYRYQKSWTIGNEMIVVRADSWEDFKEAIMNVMPDLPKTQAFPNDSGPKATAPDEVQNVPICAVHNMPMVWHGAGVSKKTNKPYPGFWSCKQRNGDGSYCNYKPEK